MITQAQRRVAKGALPVAFLSFYRDKMYVVPVWSSKSLQENVLLLEAHDTPYVINACELDQTTHMMGEPYEQG